MANYVLIHGGNMSTETWNRLAGRNDYPPGGHLGSKYWDGTVSALRAQNHRVFAPALKNEHSSNLTGHIEQICTLITANDLKDVILVGHSYGGMVITDVAARMANKIRRLVWKNCSLTQRKCSRCRKPISSAQEANLSMLPVSPNTKLPPRNKAGPTLSCRHRTFRWLTCRTSFTN